MEDVSHVKDCLVGPLNMEIVIHVKSMLRTKPKLNMGLTWKTLSMLSGTNGGVSSPGVSIKEHLCVFDGFLCLGLMLRPPGDENP